MEQHDLAPEALPAQLLRGGDAGAAAADDDHALRGPAGAPASAHLAHWINDLSPGARPGSAFSAVG